MTAPFRLYGAELSPYSLKVRSFLRFKGLEFEWLTRTGARQEEFARYAKKPLLPVLVDADENALQDSTAIIDRLDAQSPEPSIWPDDAALAFISALLEDYADEWLNKAMFHYRWSYPEDQESAAKRITDMIFEGAEKPEGIEAAVRLRMVGRLYHVGSSIETAALIEGSFTRLLAILDRMLEGRAYLFGRRPALADFGLYGQLAQLSSDPTPGAVLRERAPRVVQWIERMDAPRVEGDFLALRDVREDLAALMREEIAGAYLPWMDANARAVAEDASGVSVEIAGGSFVQKPQRTAAKAFAEIRRKRAAITDEALASLLEETGCATLLAASTTLASPEMAPDADAEVGDEEGDDAEAERDAED